MFRRHNKCHLVCKAFTKVSWASNKPSKMGRALFRISGFSQPWCRCYSLSNLPWLKTYQILLSLQCRHHHIKIRIQALRHQTPRSICWIRRFWRAPLIWQTAEKLLSRSRCTLKKTSRKWTWSHFWSSWIRGNQVRKATSSRLLLLKFKVEEKYQCERRNTPTLPYFDTP